MRAGCTGALGRLYLHSHVTESLWNEVTETLLLYQSALASATMLASLCSHPKASFDRGEEAVKARFARALDVIPYLKRAGRAGKDGVDRLVEEWKKANAEAEEAGQEEV